MIILVGIPFLMFMSVFFTLFSFRQSIRESFVYSIGFLFLFVHLITEFLSLLNSINIQTISVTWLIFTFVFIIYLISTNRLYKITEIGRTIQNTQVKNFYLYGIFFIAITTFTIGIICPPNNYDSLTYHMTRVMQWIQNENVNHFATRNARQLSLGPLAEYGIMHLQILTNSDFFANTIQWISMMGCIVLVSLVIRDFGLSINIQYKAAFLCITIPMGILQATTTQNDYVISFFILFIYWKIFEAYSKSKLLNCVLISLIAALAILTKGTAYVYLFPAVILVVWNVITIRGKNSIHKIYKLFLSVLIIAALIFPFFYRNYLTFQNPLGGSESGSVINECINFETVTSNIIRNASLHLPAPIPNSDIIVHKIVDKFHVLCNMSVLKGCSTYSGLYSLPGGFSFNEDVIPNFFHFILVLIALTIFALHRNSFNSIVKLHFIIICSIYFIYSVLLKFQIWGSRLMLPLFIISIPFMSFVLKDYTKILYVSIALLFFYSFGCLFFNIQKPIIGNNHILNMERNLMRFSGKKDLLIKHENLINEIEKRNLKNIGLIVGGNGIEYPFWYLIKKENPQIRIDQIVNNTTTNKFDCIVNLNKMSFDE